MNTPPQVPNIQTNAGVSCEKCHAQMLPAKVFRLTGCLVALGFTLLIPALIGLVILILVSVIGLGTSTAVVSSLETKAHSNAVVALEKIEGVPAGYVALFRTNAVVALRQTNSVPDSVRPAVGSALQDYLAARTGSAAAGAGMAVAGGAFSIVGFIILFPALVIGFLLVMRKKVWRCTQCGFIFDRA